MIKLVSEAIRSFEKMLNESMSLPASAEKVWWNGGAGDDCAIFLKGTDGKYYNVYPNYGDSYTVDNKSDKYIYKISRKIEQAFANQKISCNAFPYSFEPGTLVIEMRCGEEEFKPYLQRLHSWLEKKGFTFVKYDDMYNAETWKLNNYDASYDEAEINQKIQDMQDVTDKVGQYFNNNYYNAYGLKGAARNALSVLTGSNALEERINKVVKEAIRKNLKTI